MRISKKHFLYIAVILCSVFILCILSFMNRNKQNQPVTYTDFYFNTVVSLTFYNERDCSLSDQCFELCNTYEKMFSRTMEGSDIWRINHSNGNPVTVSEETYYLINEALYYCELTEGKIDITIAPLMDLWNFTGNPDEQSPPSPEEINELLQHVDYRMIELGDNNTVILKDPEAAIDLGFIVKGYVADKLKEYLTSQNVTSAVINLGGNISVIGNKPDGSPYTIGIQEPFAPTGTTLDIIQISDSSAVTSGTYQRYYEYDNTLYHHILDATTGYPVDNSLSGITILCPSSTQADALSTTCFIMGEKEALNHINALEDTECILIKTNGSLIRSDG